MDEETRSRSITHADELFGAAVHAFSLSRDGAATDELPELEPLQDALTQRDDEMGRHLEAIARCLRQRSLFVDFDLSRAQRGVESQLRVLRGSNELIDRIGRTGVDRLIAAVDARRRLALRVLSIEEWGRGWSTSESGGSRGA